MRSKLLLLNGNVYTFDPAVPKPQSVAMHGTRVAGVHKSSDLRDLIDSGDWQIVDLRGRPVLPGFTDWQISAPLCPGTRRSSPG